MKNKYSINNDNQLLISSPKEKKPLLVNGRFSIDSTNDQLIYWLNESIAWRRQYNLPNKISFKGNWKLSSNYDLELNLDKTSDQYQEDSMILKGEIISTDRDTLVFEIKSYDREGLTHLQLLKLKGFWQADEFNRIIFIVSKKTSPDILTLEGSWQINQNQQITYTYEKTSLKRKTRVSNTLTFEGFWQIDSANRLTYILERSLKSRFDFRVQLESPNLYPRERVIKYRIGIGLRQEKPIETKIIYIYGTWKFSRRGGLTFEMDYGKGKIHSIEFGANVYLTKKDEITLSLSDKEKEPLGICITFTHRFLKKLDAETFLRLKGSVKESSIEGRMRIPF